MQQHGVDTTLLQLLLDRRGEKSYYLAVPGASALTEWQKLRGLVEQTGYWPVILGQSKNLEMLEDDFASTKSTAEIIEVGLMIDPVAWFKNQFDGMYDNEESYEELHGDWPIAAEPGNDFTLPFDILTGEPFPLVFLALVPTFISWQIPAFLTFGNWNDCPLPEEHVSVMKYWQALYGAEIVGMSDEVIELLVAKPPQDRTQALALAQEQYAYCPDIVYQSAVEDVGTIENLAAILLEGRVWYFWWD